MIRPYSFRFPSDVRTVLEPWRKRLSDSSGTSSFDSVVALLTDRDRAIENYLSLGVAQGFLGLEINGSSYDIGVLETDVTDCSITVNVPAGRKLKISWHVHLTNNDFVHPGGNNTVRIRAYEGTNLIAFRSHANIADSANAFDSDTADIDGEVFDTPDAGEHTYKITAEITHGPSENMTVAAGGAYISVEDIGPAERFQ